MIENKKFNETCFERTLKIVEVQVLGQYRTLYRAILFKKKMHYACSLRPRKRKNNIWYGTNTVPYNTKLHP